MSKWKKIIARAKWHLKELAKTFSGEHGFYSSKRIERAILFINANVMLDIMIIHLMTEKKLDAVGALMIYAGQMVYAGYQTKQIFAEKQNHINNGTNSNT